MYYILLLFPALLLPAGSVAQVRLGSDPAMTRGAAGAPVTIVEFSDYQ